MRLVVWLPLVCNCINWLERMPTYSSDCHALFVLNCHTCRLSEQLLIVIRVGYQGVNHSLPALHCQPFLIIIIIIIKPI